MKKQVLVFMLLSLFGLLLIFGSCTDKGDTTPAKRYDVEDFFRNPEKAAFKLSPDGNHYAFMAPFENCLNVYVCETGKEKAIRLTSDSARSIYGFFWGNNNRILYLKDIGGDENIKLFGVDIDGSNLAGLTDFEKVRTTVIDELPEIDDYIIVGLNKRNPEVFDPYRLNIHTGELTMLAENPGNIVGWMTDHDGKLRVAAQVVDGVNVSLLYRDAEEDPFTSILTTTFKEDMSPAFFTFDNKKLYAISNLNRDKTAVVIFDPVTAKEEKVLYENPEFDVARLHYSRARKVLTTAGYISWKMERHFFDRQTEEMFSKLKNELENAEMTVVSSNKAEDKWIVRTVSDRSMGVYYLYDQKKGSLDRIAEVAPWLDENEMARMMPIEYQSRDGLRIPGYLTLPKGYTMDNARNLAVVVNPHGGPWYRDQWGFNPEVQFLANRGYAVLQMNFRGSTGYGRKFWESSFKQWGRAMQDDITDGVNWLIEQGIADKDRIAIYGGSYGGYATLAGVTLTPDIYAAAVDYVGVSNMFTFMQTIPPYWKPLQEMWYEMVGHPVKDSLLLYEVSPVFHVDKIRTPLFIAQGANDPRVNVNESNQMVEALKANGISVEYMLKDNEGHGFYNEDNRFDFYHAMDKFLDQHLNKKIQD